MTKIIPKHLLNNFTCGDCLEVMKTIPDESVDLIITSPPYNLGSQQNSETNNRKWKNSKLLNAGYENHNDIRDQYEYVEWQQNCLDEMFRIIPEDGAIFYNHKWRVQNKVLNDRSDIISRLKKHVRQILIWKRSGGINFNEAFFLPTFEVIYIIAKSKFKIHTNACQLTDVWEIKQEMNNVHPAPFPMQIPERIIQSTNAKIVLDPFMGSGTTALAARKLGRNYIGIDLSEKYCEMARNRTVKNKVFF